MSTVYISFCADINFKTTQVLLATTFDQIAKGATHIYYLISTPGGLVTPGIQAYNVLKGLPVETTMHNTGAIDSTGNVIFLAGKNRIACPQSSFMFHGVAFDLNGNVHLDQKKSKEYLDSVLAEQKKFSGIFKAETSLVESEIDGLFIDAQTKDPDFALSKGIIQRILPVAIPVGVNPIQLVF